MALSDAGLVFRYGLSESSFTQFDDAGPNAAHLDSNSAGSILTTTGTSPHKGVASSANSGVGHLSRLIADSGDAIRTALDGKKQFRIVMVLKWGTVTDDRTLFTLNQRTAAYGSTRLGMSFRSNQLMPRWNGSDCTYANIARGTSGDTTFHTYEFQIDTNLASGRIARYLDGVSQGASDSGISQNSTLSLPTGMQLALFGSEGDVPGWNASSFIGTIAYLAVHVDQAQSATLASDTHTALALDDDTFGAGEQALTAPLTTRARTIYAPGITGGATPPLAPPLVTRTRSLYAPSVTGGAVTAKTYLDFQPNGAVDSMARIEWPNDATTLRKSSTFIFEHIPNSGQVGYGANVWFSLEGWATTDDKGWAVGFHPAYPCDLTYDATGQRLVGGGSSGTTHCPEIAGNGALDVIANSGSSGTATATDKGISRIYAAVITSSGGTTTHTFYRNLPSTAAADKFSFSRPTSEIDAYTPTGAKMRYGSSPWTDNSPFAGRNDETAEGKSRFFKVFSAPLSETDLALEAVEPSNTPVTTAGLASVYYTNVNPTSTDITDKSGQGNNPAWANAYRPADYSEQIVAPPLVSRSRSIYAPALVQAGGATQTLTAPLVSRSRSIYAPSLGLGAVTISPPLTTRARSIYAPSLGLGAVTINPPLTTRARSVYAPALGIGAGGEQTISPPLTTRARSAFPPELAPGEITISAPLTTRSRSIYPPVLAYEAITIAPPLVDRSRIIFFPRIDGGATPSVSDGFLQPIIRRRRR